jgi:hypothetical protein
MHILDLPEELLHNIITSLPRGDLCNFNLVNRHCYGSATPWIWREVELIDCRSTRQRPRLRTQSGQRGDGDGDEVVDDAAGGGGDVLEDCEDRSLEDEHDDTPLIAKLLVILG